MITELKQSTVQLCGGPRDGSIVKLKKSKDKPKHYDCLNERCYQSLYNDGYLHVYELVCFTMQNDKVISRYMHAGMAEVTK